MRLISLPNVIVSSHQAFLTTEALEHIAATTINTLTRYFSGDPDTTTEVVCQNSIKSPRRKAWGFRIF